MADLVSGDIRELCMSLQNHLVELQRRHDALDREISTALLHPAADDVQITTVRFR